VYVASWTISYLDRACFEHGVWQSNQWVSTGS
jgi:hypothetical protein